MRAALLSLALLLPAMPAAADPPEAAVRTLVLVRHGHYLPDPAADEKLGPGLSELGVAQARLAGGRLAGEGSFDRVLASPMTRAQETARVIVDDLGAGEAITDPDLAECTPSTRRAAVNDSVGEADRKACEAQFDRAFARHFVPAQGQPRRELLVCHGNAIRYLLTRALGVERQAWLEMSLGHVSFSTVRIAADGSMQVIAAGDVGHLPPGLRTGSSADPERSLAVP